MPLIPIQAFLFRRQHGSRNVFTAVKSLSSLLLSGKETFHSGTDPDPVYFGLDRQVLRYIFYKKAGSKQSRHSKVL